MLLSVITTTECCDYWLLSILCCCTVWSYLCHFNEIQPRLRSNLEMHIRLNLIKIWAALSAS